MSRHRAFRLHPGLTRPSLARRRGAAALATVLTMLAPTAAHAASVTGRGEAVPVPQSDMQITVVASAGFVTGSSATYTLTVDNLGPPPAAGPFTVTNTLPAGFTFTSATSATWACSAAGQVVTCTRGGTFAKNAPETISVVAFITSSAATSVTNVATLSDPNANDPNLANNTASTTSAVTVYRVATTPDGATVSQLPSNGTNYTQTFVVTNTGSLADSYTLTATVTGTAGVVTIVSVAGTAGSSAITVPPVTTTTPRNVPVVYSVATGAATGASATITLTATSTFTGQSTDAGTLTVTVARAGITMVKQLYRDDRTTLVTGGAAVATGEYVQYRVSVTNGGGAGATTVSVADAIPAQVTYVTASGDLAGWTFLPAVPNPTLTATLAGTLTPSTTRFFWIRVRVK